MCDKSKAKKFLSWLKAEKGCQQLARAFWYVMAGACESAAIRRTASWQCMDIAASPIACYTEPCADDCLYHGPQVASIRGSVYLKYNPRSGLAYVSQYGGQCRGVLLQLGQQQFGHFPLGLFDEQMSNPEPIL